MEDLRAFIPQLEKEHLTEYINYYIDSNCGNLCDDIDHLLRFWANNKIDLYHLLGNNITLSREVNYEIDNEELGDKISDELSSVNMDIGDEIINANKFLDSLDNIRWTWYPFQGYDKNDESTVRTFLSHLTDYKALAGNKLMYSNMPKSVVFTKGPHVGDKPLEIKTDTKLMRIYAKLVDWFDLDKEAFEQFRLTHSRWLNDRFIKANMVLSIHPLDYLTMSDNNCCWDSCMSWYNPGDYRLGTIEMMNSPVVVEAYLESEHPYHPINARTWTWSNKRWRCLYIVNKNVITEVKQYPYYNDYLSRFTLSWLKDLATKNMGWAFLDNLYSLKSGGNNEIGDSKIYVKMSTNAMYNDYYDTHNAYISAELLERIIINYSGETECMHCGGAYYQSDFQESDHVVCAKCEGLTLCVHCECWTNSDEMTFDEDGNGYCYWCAQDLFKTCDCCGQTALADDEFTICPSGFKLAVFTPENRHSYRVAEGNYYLCDDCYGKFNLKDVNKERNYFGRLEIDMNDMPEELVDAFDVSVDRIKRANENAKATYPQDYAKDKIVIPKWILEKLKNK